MRLPQLVLDDLGDLLPDGAGVGVGVVPVGTLDLVPGARSGGVVNAVEVGVVLVHAAGLALRPARGIVVAVVRDGDDDVDVARDVLKCSNLLM